MKHSLFTFLVLPVTFFLGGVTVPGRSDSEAGASMASGNSCEVVGDSTLEMERKEIISLFHACV